MPKYSPAPFTELSESELLDMVHTSKQRLKYSGKILRDLRKAANLTQRGMAEKVHVVQSTYAGYENGHHQPDMEVLIQLAKFHGVTLDYISGRIFDEWIIEPFFNMRQVGQCQVDLCEHSKQQYKDMSTFSDTVMEARMHGEYAPNESDPPAYYRKLIDRILGRTK